MIHSSQHSTRRRVIAMFALSLVVYVGLNALMLGGLVFPQFAAIERDHAIRDIDRVAQAIRRELEFLADFSRDWAHWDDTYHFVLDGDPQFIASNLTEDVTLNLPAEAFGLYAIDGSPRFTAAYHGALPYRDEVLALMAPGGELHRRLVQPLLDPATDYRGQETALFRLQGRPLLAVAHAVLQSNREGPSHGVLVMAKVFDEADREAIAAQTLVSFELFDAGTAPEVPPPDAEPFTTRTGDPGRIRPLDNDRLQLRVRFETADGGAFVALTEFSRTISRQGMWALSLAALASTLSFILLVAMLYRRLLRRSFLLPLRAAEKTLQQIEDQRDFALRLPESGAVELQRLAHSFNRMMAELEQHRDEIALLSRTDALTGLANRRGFEQAWSCEWARALRQREPLAILLCDIDCFKAYNDHYGHPAGDACLRQVAGALRGALKRATDHIARFGGEEFVVVLPHTDAEQAQEIAERLLQAVRDLHLPHAYSTVHNELSLSIGLKVGQPTADGDPVDWLQQADQALYQAKQAGRNRVVA